MSERIATALERIADAMDPPHSKKFNPGCDVGGDYRLRCAATMPGHRCTRAEHADDRHQWTMTDEEYDRRREEAGVPRDVFDDVRAWADGREAAQQEDAQRRLTAGCSDRGGECGQLDGSGAAVGSDRHVAPAKCALSEPHQGPHMWVDVVARSLETGEYVPMSVTARKEADPLDESDHRPRHDSDGDHWQWDGNCWTHHSENGYEQELTLHSILRYYGHPLTFCDCDPTDSDRATD